MKRGKTSSMLGQSRGQIKLSFGMIFSIILIVIFIAFAFYAIKIFLGLQGSAEIKKFVNDLQLDIDRVWKSDGASQEREYILPSKVEYVCFVDDEYQNLIFQASEFIKGTKIDRIDVQKTTEGEDPFCIKNIDGKIKIRLQKDFREALVTIVR